MLKKIIGVFICMLMISGAFVSASNLLTDKKEFINNGNTISVMITTGSYEIIEERTGYEASITDFGRLLVPGKPSLPSKIFSIAIPPGAQVQDVTFEAKNSITLPGEYKIAPNQLPRVIGPESSVCQSQDQQQYEENYKSIYGSDNPYPASIGEVVGTGGYRKYNLIDVRITPMIYYPISGKLVYHQDITVNVDYTVPEKISTQDIMVDNLAITEKTAEKIIINYDQAQQWYPSSPGGREQYNYVIITLDSLTDAVTPLADWESAKGRSVNVVTTSWISTNYQGYDLAAKMREFLREKYPSEEWGITDVCLVGGYDDVPMRRCAQNQGYGQPETDYYYAELSLPDSESWDANGNHQYGENSDPIDFESEVNVGRIPWSDPDTVQSICEKSIAYEQNTDDSFKKNILLLGAFFWSDTDNAKLMEYKSNPANYPWMSDWTNTKMYEDAQSSYPCDYDLSYNNVKTVWSEGTFAFVNWAGHGSPDACYEYYPSQPFVDEDTCLYLNDDYPAIIFADACSNSDTDDLNIGQAMLKQGGVGFLGATKVAYGMPAWDDPYDGSSQSLDCFFTTHVTSGNYTQGEAHQWALREMYINDLWYYPKYEMFEWGALWGNPCLSMAPAVTSTPPVTPTEPVGPARGVRNVEYLFSSSTTDPDGDQIYYMFSWDDGTSSDWLGPYTSGSSITAAHAWTDLGVYNIKIRAKDINGATSDWSEPHEMSIVLNEAPNIPTIQGPETGKPGNQYLFSFQTTDNNGDDVYYYVDWGDGTTSDWLGPFKSGVEATTTHSWSEEGTYTVKIKAKDVVGDESDWGTMEVVMPFDYRFSFQTFLENLFDMFPHLFPVIRSLFGY